MIDDSCSLALLPASIHHPSLPGTVLHPTVPTHFTNLSSLKVDWHHSGISCYGRECNVNCDRFIPLCSASPPSSATPTSVLSGPERLMCFTHPCLWCNAKMQFFKKASTTLQYYMLMDATITNTKQQHLSVKEDFITVAVTVISSDGFVSLLDADILQSYDVHRQCIVCALQLQWK